MKIKSIGFLTAAAIILTIGTANANMLFDVYAGGTYGFGGYTMFNDDNHISKSAMSYGAVLGLDIPLFRIELEYNYLDSDAITANLGFVNAYFKLPTPIAKPYIGAGIGSTFDSKYKPSDVQQIDIDDTITYQGMLGLTFDLPIIPFDIDIEGRVIYAPDIFEIANASPDLLQYDGRVKLRYVF